MLFTMSEPVETIDLNNGLKLKIYNHSRKMAGDRWLVFFEARVVIEIKRDYFNKPDNEISYDEIKKELGEKVIFRYEKRRNFIDVREKDRIFEELKNQFLNTALKYISSNDFPERFILNNYYQRTGKVKGMIKF